MDNKLFDDHVSKFTKNIRIAASIVEKQKNNFVPEFRVASIHSSTLMIASLFEVFVRDIATKYAELRIPKYTSIKNVPSKFIMNLLERTNEIIRKDMREQMKEYKKGQKKEHLRLSEYFKKVTEFEFRINNMFEFLKGDLSKNIYDDLIYNKYNMSAKQLNEIFNICDISGICNKICEKGESTAKLFPPTENKNTNFQFHTDLEIFNSRRNNAAHKIDLSTSASHDEFYHDCEMLIAFARDLSSILEEILSRENAVLVKN